MNDFAVPMVELIKGKKVRLFDSSPTTLESDVLRRKDAWAVGGESSLSNFDGN